MTSTSINQNLSSSWVSLADSQLICVSGPDAAKFLQGQVTCDIRELEAVSRIGAQCNPKGRILLSFRALQMTPETIALRIPVSMREKAMQNLGKYIVFSKAKLLDKRSDFQLIGLYGPGASLLAARLFSDLPQQVDGFVEKAGNFLIQLDSGRYECWINNESYNDVTQQISPLATQATLNDWSLLEIKSGVASITPETYETFTPQDVNYQLVNAINFRKGCYTGQEIVARLHYRGKLKRHMYRFEMSTGDLPQPGDAICIESTQQTVGQLVAAARRDAQTVELLVSVSGENLDDLALVGKEEKLKRLALPYAIPTADEKPE